MEIISKLFFFFSIRLILLQNLISIMFFEAKNIRDGSNLHHVRRFVLADVTVALETNVTSELVASTIHIALHFTSQGVVCYYDYIPELFNRSSLGSWHFPQNFPLYWFISQDNESSTGCISVSGNALSCFFRSLVITT